MAKLKIKTPGILALDVKLAVALKNAGVNSHERVAIFIHQLQFYLSIKSKSDKYKKIDGQKYTYMNYKEWGVVFPHWGAHTVRRIITEAERLGIVVSVLKGRGQMARSKWYSINSKKLMSYLLDVETVQVGQSQPRVEEKSDSEGVQVGQFNPSRSVQVGQFAQAITEVANTEVTFPLKKDEGSPFGEKRELLPKLDTLSGTVTEITPNNIKNIKARFPHLTTKEIEVVWFDQEGYWRKSKLNNHELEGKVISWLSKTISTKETKSDDEVWEMVENEQ